MSAIHCSTRPRRAFSELTFQVANLVMCVLDAAFWSGRIECLRRRRLAVFGRLRPACRRLRLRPSPSSAAASSPSPPSSSAPSAFLLARLLGRRCGLLGGRLRRAASCRLAAVALGARPAFLAQRPLRGGGGLGGALALRSRAGASAALRRVGQPTPGRRQIDAAARRGEAVDHQRDRLARASSPHGRSAAAGCPSAAAARSRGRRRSSRRRRVTSTTRRRPLTLLPIGWCWMKSRNGSSSLTGPPRGARRCGARRTTVAAPAFAGRAWRLRRRHGPGGGAVGTGIGWLASLLAERDRWAPADLFGRAVARRRWPCGSPVPSPGTRLTKTQPTCGTGLPPTSRPSSNSHG